MNVTKTATQGCGTEVREVKGEIGNGMEATRVEIQVRDKVEPAPESDRAMQAPGNTVGGGKDKRRYGLMAIGLGTLAFAVLAGFAWFNEARHWVKTDNAYLLARIHQLSSRVAGTVQEVLAEDNQSVKAGEVIARLDPKDFELRRDQARAQVTQAHAQWQQTQAQIEQAVARVAQEQARETKAQQDLSRAETLFNRSAAAISKQELDATQAEFDAARAALRAAQSALSSTKSMAGAAEAQEQVTRTALQDAELQLSYTELRAPAAGRIGRKNIEVGNRVQTGQALFALVQPDVWVVANFKETQLAYMSVGHAVRLQIDAFPGHVFTGRVDSIAPASGAQFALLPPDNATGNFTKIVQRIPVKIILDPQSIEKFRGRLAAGMSVMVEVRVR